MRQSISRAHGHARDVDKVEIKVLEEHHPACLMPGQLLWLVKVCQVLVIGKKSDGVVGSLEIVMPVVEGMYYY